MDLFYWEVSILLYSSIALNVGCSSVWILQAVHFGIVSERLWRVFANFALGRSSERESSCDHWSYPLSELIGTRMNMILFFFLLFWCLLLTYIVLLARKDKQGNIPPLVVNPSCGVIMCVGSLFLLHLKQQLQFKDDSGQREPGSLVAYLVQSPIREGLISAPCCSGLHLVEFQFSGKQKLRNRTETILFEVTEAVLFGTTYISANEESPLQW